MTSIITAEVIRWLHVQLADDFCRDDGSALLRLEDRDAIFFGDLQERLIRTEVPRKDHTGQLLLKEAAVDLRLLLRVVQLLKICIFHKAEDLDARRVVVIPEIGKLHAGPVDIRDRNKAVVQIQQDRQIVQFHFSGQRTDLDSLHG